MDPRYDTRLKEMLAQAEIRPELTEGFPSRLEIFMLPFAASMVCAEQRRHALKYLTGLLSKLDHKTGEGIASMTRSEKVSRKSYA